MRSWLLVLGACGRIGFDPQSAGGDDGTGPDAPGVPGDAATDGKPPASDAMSACADAIAVAVGSTAPLDTCSGEDRIDACAPNKRELVFRFVPAVTGSYTIKARDAGSQNVSNSTARLDAMCGLRLGCGGILTTPFTAGVAVYFAVEPSVGACATIQFDIAAN